jgi:hypothetical protein
MWERSRRPLDDSARYVAARLALMALRADAVGGTRTDPNRIILESDDTPRSAIEVAWRMAEMPSSCSSGPVRRFAGPLPTI